MCAVCKIHRTAALSHPLFFSPVFLSLSVCEVRCHTIIYVIVVLDRAKFVLIQAFSSCICLGSGSPDVLRIGFSLFKAPQAVVKNRTRQPKMYVARS